VNQQRYDILQQLLAEGRVKVDLETGLVYNYIVQDCTLTEN
jgi:hypothetical protein